jgi:hypothetical protein
MFPGNYNGGLFSNWPDTRSPRKKFWDDEVVPTLVGFGCLIFVLAMIGGVGFAVYGVYKAVCP